MASVWVTLRDPRIGKMVFVVYNYYILSMCTLTIYPFIITVLMWDLGLHPIVKQSLKSVTGRKPKERAERKTTWKYE